MLAMRPHPSSSPTEPAAAAVASESVVWMTTPLRGVKGATWTLATICLMASLSVTAVAREERKREGRRAGQLASRNHKTDIVTQILYCTRLILGDMYRLYFSRCTQN